MAKIPHRQPAPPNISTSDPVVQSRVHQMTYSPGHLMD